MRCSGKTKNGTRCKLNTTEGKRCNKHRKMKGGSTAAPAALNKFLNDHVDWDVERVYVAQKPIDTAVRAALDTLSNYEFSRTAKRLGYAEVYHNYLLLQLRKRNSLENKVIKLEKNETVQIKPLVGKDKDTPRIFKALAPPPGTNLKTMIDRTVALQGYKNFYDYDARDFNCQRFTNGFLVANNLISPEEMNNPIATEIQDGQALIASLGALSSLPKAVTDFAGSWPIQTIRYYTGI